MKMLKINNLNSLLFNGKPVNNFNEHVIVPGGAQLDYKDNR